MHIQCVINYNMQTIALPVVASNKVDKFVHSGPPMTSPSDCLTARYITAKSPFILFIQLERVVQKSKFLLRNTSSTVQCERMRQIYYIRPECFLN